ncbi:MAG: transposase [Candidatus Kapabacteria bacterium]|nr:transposase [Candidatus Kapabacteria bacterium]MBX7153696.1 transposase [Bacteroidota bacterium]
MRRNRTYSNEYPCWFVTTTFHDWLHLLLDDSYYLVLSNSINYCCEKYSADIIGYVWMPSHIHFVVYFNVESKLSDFMRDFKKFASSVLRRKLQEDNRLLVEQALRYQNRTQEFRIWMSRYDAVPLWTREILLTKINYIHNNPVKCKLCVSRNDYQFSSAGFYESAVSKDIVKVRHVSELIW